MKSKIAEELKEIVSQSIDWAKLEVEYFKLSGAEKLIVLLSTMIVGGIIVVMLLPVFIMFLFSLVSVFRLIMPLALAYLTVGGIVLVLLTILFFLRKPLIVTPVSRFITKLLLEKKNQNPS